MGSYKLKRFFLSLLVLFVLFSACSKSYATVETTFNAEQEIIDLQKQFQDEFILQCLYPYLNNSQAWQLSLKPVFDTIHNNAYDVYISRSASGSTPNTSLFYIRCFHYRENLGNTTVGYVSQTYPNITQSIVASQYDCYRYNVIYNANDNTYTVSTTTDSSFKVPACISSYKSELWFHFMELVYGDTNDYNTILQDISNYLDDIENNTFPISDMYLTLTTIASSVSTIASHDYTTAISNITTKLTNINTNLQTANSTLSDISTYASQLNDKIQALNNFLNNTNLNTNTITNNFPDNSNIVSPTDSIVTSLFTEYQNAFTSTNYVDIVFPIPFSNETITIPSNYSETNFPSWAVTIIQLTYWYCISRWIILYLIHTANSLRNANFIESSSNADPKTELL